MKITCLKFHQNLIEIDLLIAIMKDAGNAFSFYYFHARYIEKKYIKTDEVATQKRIIAGKLHNVLDRRVILNFTW